MPRACLFMFMALTAATGCPAKKADPTPATAQACKKFGEQCEYAAGKLGTCVERATCNPGESCLVCQSQH